MYSWCCAYDCAVQFITFTAISVRNTAVANAHFSEAWVFILCVIGFDGKTTACIAVDCGFDLRMTQDALIVTAISYYKNLCPKHIFFAEDE